MFISEQARAVYEVRDFPAAKNDVGYRVAVTGEVDEKAKTVSIKSVKRLSEVTAMCMVPKKRRVQSLVGSGDQMDIILISARVSPRYGVTVSVTPFLTPKTHA